VVGDFVPEGSVLIEVYGGEPGRIGEGRLRAMIALGSERTIEQAPTAAPSPG
jgi:hypothetical protein